MNETRLRLLFILLFAISFCAITMRVDFYPAIRFPHFVNKKMGAELSYSEVKLYSYKDNKEVNLMGVIKPFDKQYYLFAQRALVDEKTSRDALFFIDQLHKQQHSAQDSLYLSVEVKNADIP